MPYSYNTDIQSLKTGFFGRGGNIIILAENGSYGRYYSGYRAYVTLMWPSNCI